MKLLKGLLVCVAAYGCHAGAYAAEENDVQDGSRFDEELNERDFEALRQFLRSRRDETADEEASNLVIAGDVRFEWRHLNETQSGRSLRGGNAFDPRTVIPISRNDFDCEFNLRFDYVMDRAWAIAHLQYDNSAGVDSEDRTRVEDPQGWFGSGKCGEICLKRAFIGYNIYDDACSRLDIELGRRGNLYYVFDSKVQFLSRMDGILLKYEGKNELFSNWYAKVAGFVVDERVNHFALATEVGFLDIADSGFDLKYSFIDWNKHGRGRAPVKIAFEKQPDGQVCEQVEFVRNPEAFRFYVSQWTLCYHLDPALLCRPAKLYGAFVWNHGQHYATYYRHGIKHKTPANTAWYVGVAIGEVVKEGDWALEVQYQVVGALAVPDEDMSGIGRGNVLDDTYTFNRRGNTNFRGWRVEGLYALTDELSIDTIVEHSIAAKRRIGGSHTYSKVEVEAIYAF